MKPSLLLLISSALLATLLLTSCGDCSKKVDCPAYNDTLLNAFFPYADNQQLVYKTIANEQQLFSLKNTETSGAYQAFGGPLGGLPSCDAHKTFQSNEADTSGRPLFKLDLRSGNYTHGAYFTIGRSFIQMEIVDTGFNQIYIDNYFARPEKQSTLVLGNRTFANVVIAKRDTANIKAAGIYTIYYTKPEGLIGYSVYPSLKTWVKQ